MIYDIKEFDPDFNYDLDDLNSQGTGSGVHKKEDVEVVFNIMDRNGYILKTKQDVINSKFCSAIVFDIADKNGTIVEPSFQSGLDNKIIITKTQNELIFGNYQKDFGIKATVIDDTSLYTPSGYLSLYGNNLEIRDVETIDSSGTTKSTETNGVYLSGNLQPSGYIYSGKLYGLDGYDLPLKYGASGNVTHEGSDYLWEAYLSWETQPEDLSGFISYDNFSSDINNFSGNNGSWNLVIMDYSPNESFLIASGSRDFYNPFGAYVDALGSGYIKERLNEPEIIPSGKDTYPYRGIPEDRIDIKVNLLNKGDYTEYSHIDIFAYQGKEIDLNGFTFTKRIDNLEDSSYFAYDEGIGLQYNTKTWFKYQAYSALGPGETWITGPFVMEKELEPIENINSSSQVKISSTENAAVIDFKEREVDYAIYSGSGILDKIFVNQTSPYAQTGLYDYQPSGTTEATPDYYSMTIDEKGKWKNTTFDYTFEFREEDDFYSVETRKIIITPTGSSKESGNYGYPLFKIKDDFESGNSVSFNLEYFDSGFMLLCNTSGNPFDIYKYYKTSI